MQRDTLQGGMRTVFPLPTRGSRSLDEIQTVETILAISWGSVQPFRSSHVYRD